MMLSPLLFLSSWSLLAWIEFLLCLASISCLGWVIYTRFFHPYADIPGPFWASFSSIYYMRGVSNGDASRFGLALHKKYGPVVRIQPNEVSIAYPEAINTIYGAHTEFLKTNFYDAFQSHMSKYNDTFSERDETIHAHRRKIVNGLYTQNSILEFEPRFNVLIGIFCERMAELADSGQAFDISTWILRYTFDVIGELFHGRDGGFGNMRDGIDYGDFIHTLSKTPTPVALMCHVPNGLKTLYLLSHLFSAETRRAVTGFQHTLQCAKSSVAVRVQDIADGKETPQHDLLSKLLQIVREKGEKLDFTMADVQTEVYASIWAGSDTSAFAMTAILYNVLKQPRVHHILLTELNDALDSGALSYPIRYLDAVKLPYLNAVVKEGLRIHPALGLGLPRHVPAGGAEIVGKWYPGGYKVSVNANVVHFNKNVFGEDSEHFVPERWLRTGDEGRARMERAILTFGAGSRMCIGKNITITEMYKLVPTFLTKFDVQLADPGKGWKTRMEWFFYTKDVMVKVKKRS